MATVANIKGYINGAEWGVIKETYIDQCGGYKPGSNNLLFLSGEGYREEFELNQLSIEEMKTTIGDFGGKQTSSPYTKDLSNAIQIINCHLGKTNRSYCSYGCGIQCPIPDPDDYTLSTVKLSELIDLRELQEGDKYSIVIFSYNIDAAKTEQEDESVNIYVINDIYDNSDKDVGIMDNELLNILRERQLSGTTESVVLLAS